MVEFFQSDFDEVVMQEYDHWESGEQVINVPAELDKIAHTISHSPEDEWFVCSKSIGTLLTLIAKQEGIISPKKSLLFGMPLDLAEEDLFKGDWSALSGYGVPSMAFHNEDDPVANCQFSEDKIKEQAPEIEFVKTPGDTHEYLDFARYGQIIKNFLLK